MEINNKADNVKIQYRDKLTNFMSSESHELSISNMLYSVDTLDNLHLQVVPGVLKLSSHSFKTTTKKGFIMKEFEPLFNIFPPFMVKTNKIKVTNDMYVIVRISHLNNLNISNTTNISDRLNNGKKTNHISQMIHTPLQRKEIEGTIEKYIGIVGDIATERQLCDFFGTYHWKKIVLDQSFYDQYINNYANTNFDDVSENINHDSEKKHMKLQKGGKISDIDLTDMRVDLTQQQNMLTVSVDPQGSLDIDDVISICLEQGDTSKGILGIHIADPTSYVIENSDIDNEIARRTESLYLNNKTYHMFPEELSTKLFSLKEHENKRAFSVMCYLEKDMNGVWTVKKHEIMKTMIHVNLNLSYDKFQHIVAHNSKSAHNILYEMGNHLYTQLLDPDNTTVYSSKKMIEVFMVLANMIIAEEMVKLSHELRDKIDVPIILRTQRLQTYKIDRSIIDNRDIRDIDILIDEHVMFKMSSAELSYYSPNNIDSSRRREDQGININVNSHAGLGCELYTHFTSPIRRYSDMLVHRIMYNLIAVKNNKSPPFTLNCIINNQTKQLEVHEMFMMNHFKRYYKNITRFEKDIILAQKIQDYTPNDDFMNNERVISLHGIVIDSEIRQSKSRKSLNEFYIRLRVRCIRINTSSSSKYYELDTLLKNGYHTIKITQNIDVNNNPYKLFQLIDYKLCILKHSYRKIRAFL